MTQQVNQIRGQDGMRPEREEGPAPGQCNFPIGVAIDPARHIRICGNPFEASAPAGETK